jgi:hypothetical protein
VTKRLAIIPENKSDVMTVAMGAAVFDECLMSA